MTGAVWFKRQNSTNSFIVHFVCTNRRLMVVKRRVQGIETINNAIVGIDNSSLEEKICLRITMKRFTKRLWDIVCNILLRPGVNIYTMEEILWKESQL